jgi:hypothetical protein
VRVRKYEGTKVRRYEGTKVRRYEGTKVRRCEGAKVRGLSAPHCSRPPARLTTPRARWASRSIGTQRTGSNCAREWPPLPASPPQTARERGDASPTCRALRAMPTRPRSAATRSKFSSPPCSSGGRGRERGGAVGRQFDFGRRAPNLAAVSPLSVRNERGGAGGGAPRRRSSMSVMREVGDSRARRGPAPGPVIIPPTIPSS